MLTRLTPVIAMLAILGSLAGGSAVRAASATDFSDLASGKTIEQTLADINAKSDPCRYLDSAEVTALVGEALVTPPFRFGGGRPDPNGDTCRYMISGYRGIDTGISKTGGDKLFEILTGVNIRLDAEMKTPGNLNKTLSLEGEWDEVRVFKGAGLAAIRGDTLVTVELHGLTSTPEKIAGLVNAIYRRLDNPSSYDGVAAVRAGLALDEKRPKPRDPCSLVTREDMEQSLGPIATPPTSNASSCTWDAMIDGVRRPVGYTIVWHDGYAQFNAIRSVREGLATANKPGAPPTSEEAKTAFAMIQGFTRLSEMPSGAWDFAYKSFTGVAAVKYDVMIETFSPNIPDAKIGDLLGRIISHL
jgi:hypothetical protein